MVRIKAFTLVLFLGLSLTAFAQSSGESQVKYFNIQKVNIPPILRLVEGSVKFRDADGNNTINANETCYITMKVINAGRGDGQGCRAVIKMNGTTEGITVADQNLTVIKPDEEREIRFPITSNMDIQNGQIRFAVKVEEPNGFDTQEQALTVSTHQFDAPQIRVVSYKILGDKAGTLQKSSIFKLQVMLQNTAQGVGEDVHFQITFPENISWMDGDNDVTVLPTLKAGETKTFEFELAANNRAADEVIIPIILSEKYGKYAQNTEIPLKFGQTVNGRDIVIESKTQVQKDIVIGSLLSDVDTNIPMTKDKNNNTFVVILANENYMQVAPVRYALNDGKVFHEYCTKTLGIAENHIHHVPNATLNQIKAQVNWLKSIADAFNNPRIIVYYAGHGIPDESSKTAYLLPVDGNGTDVGTGYKLDELYAALGNMDTQSVSVFMDACFSGSKREDGMLASARGVAIKVKSCMPQGNMVVFSAAQGDETAYPYDAQQHGLFTYFLLKKLQQSQGEVTYGELGDYITTQVKQQSIVSVNKSQTPSVSASSTLGTEWKTWTFK